MVIAMAKSRLQSEQSLAQLRALWCEWDPIGVLDDPDWPRDEYDDYLQPTWRLLESGAGVGAIAQYLNSVVGESLALGETGVMSTQPLLFAAKLRNWFDANWAQAAAAQKRKKA
jgi:hypothetical protein